MAEEKTPGKASTRAKNKYNAKAYDQFLITVPTGHKDLISAAAKEQGYSSRNEFIVTAINEKIQRYNTDKTQLYTLTFSTTKRKMLFCHLPFTFIAYSIFLSLFLLISSRQIINIISIIRFQTLPVATDPVLHPRRVKSVPEPLLL